MQAAIRVAITALVAAYLNSSIGASTEYSVWGRWLATIYFLISPIFLVWIVLRPQVNPARRYLAMFMEMAFFSACLGLEGARGAPLVSVYIWVCLGNGFRYGVRPMFWSTLTALVGFGSMVAASPYWQNNIYVAIGIMIANAAIPAYTAMLIKQLHAAKSAAEQASFSKSRFLATVSHELRTPLHAIIGLSELMQQTSLSSEQTEMVNTIRGSGRALLSLVEDVLDLSSIQAGRVVSQNEDFDLHRAVAEAVAIARPLAAKRGLELAIRIDPSIPAVVTGDWPHVRQILLNLITNAVKFTEEGQVTLTVRPVWMVSGEIRISFEVADTGIGIADKDMARIFETFGQANTSSTRKYGGVGLGLSIVRQLADLLKGEVSVSSMPGKGSLFTVELPFLQPIGALDKLPATHLLVHGADAALVAAITAACPDHVITQESVNSQGRTGIGTMLALVDARRLSPVELTATVREMSEQMRGGSAAVIAIGARMDEIVHTAPGVVVCVDPAQLADKLPNAVRAAAALATHREVVTSLQGETDLHTIAAFKPEDTVLGHGARVLVVEDSPVNRMVTQKILHSAGYAVILAEDADQGLEHLAEEEFDLILLDLNLPGTSGIEIIKLYRVMRLGMGVSPIVIFSADVTQEARDECIDLGVSPLPAKAQRAELHAGEAGRAAARTCPRGAAGSHLCPISAACRRNFEPSPLQANARAWHRRPNGLAKSRQPRLKPFIPGRPDGRVRDRHRRGAGGAGRQRARQEHDAVLGSGSRHPLQRRQCRRASDPGGLRGYLGSGEEQLHDTRVRICRPATL